MAARKSTKTSAERKNMENEFEFLDLMRRFHFVDIGFMLPNLPRSEIKIIISLGQCGKGDKPAEERYQMSEVAELMHVSGPAISKSIKHLEEEDLIVRINDPYDRRKSRLDLSEKGWKVYHVIEKNMTSVTDAVKAEMGEERFVQLVDLMQEFAAITERELEKKKVTNGRRGLRQYL